MEVFEWRTLLSGITFTVDTLADSVDASIGDGAALDEGGNVSLRAAIQEANATADDVMIILPTGTYTLSIMGQGEDNAFTGDLDLIGQGGEFSRSIQGAGEALTIIDGNGLDRVFHVLPGGSLSLSDLTVRGGQVTGFDGGGIHSSGTLTLFDTVVTANTGADNGGGLYVAAGTSTLNDTAVSGNSATQNGAGIFVSGGTSLQVARGSLDNNTTGDSGGGLYSLGNATLVETEVFSNVAGFSGGGIGIGAGTLSIAGTLVSQNTTSGTGGGLELSGTQSASIRFSEFRDNSAVDGGGISKSAAGNLTLFGVTVAGSNAESGAGFLQTGGSTTIINSTLSGNTATLVGGGLFNQSGIVNLQSSTIAQNVAESGGGIANDPQSSVSLRNTIVALNMATTQGADVSATAGMLSQGFNLVGTGSQGFTAGASDDLVGTPADPLNPLLGPLSENGGGLRTHQPLPGSPVIDAGDHALPTSGTDQRGVPRDLSGPGVVDIGAVETGFAGFFVDTEEDTVDVTPGDGVAADSTGQTSLRAAIQEANALQGHQTIVVPAGLYRLTLAGVDEEGALTGDLDITDDLSLHGQGSDITLIDGMSLDRVFDVHPSAVTFSDLAIQNGDTTGQAASEGGGLRMEDSSVTFNRLRFSHNTSDDRGGAVFDAKTGPAETLTINDSAFIASTAVNGGAIYVVNDSVTINRSTFSNSLASTGSGGTIHSRDGQVTISESEITGSTASVEGGAIFSDKRGGGVAPGFIAIQQSRITGSRGVNSGGAIFGNGDSLTVEDSEITGNQALFNGGGITSIDGQLTVTGSLIDGNMLTGMTVVTPQGAGIYSTGVMAVLTVTDSQISTNSAGSGSGGGITSVSQATITGSTIQGNIADLGGGIENQGQLAIQNSTITGNQAVGVAIEGGSGGSGGGVYSASGSNTTIHSSTVTQNTAAVGGGLYNDSSLVSATVTLKNTILAGNSSTEGSDSDLSGAGVSSGNNIIGDLAGGIGFSNGVSADQVGGQVSFSLSDATSDEPIEITASAHNLVTGDRVRITGVVGNVAANGVFSVTVVDALRFTLDGSTGSGNYASGGDVFRLIDPRLGQPADNLPSLPAAMNSGSFSYFPQPMIPPITAVRTETHLPLSGSPAIDAGNNTGAPANDQRGLARPVDGDGDQMDVVDIGAVELFYGSVSGSVFDDLNGNGIRDSGEPGLAGASVYHDANENGFPDSDELVVQTAIDDEATSGVDEAGTFTFVQLPPGSQIIRQIQDVAFRLTTPTATVFSAPVSLTPVTGPGASVLVDVNNDGNLDVVVLRDSNDLQVGLSDDQGMLASFTTHAVGINPVAVTATDLNADGQPDLVVANRNSNDLSILLNTGSGQFGPASSVVAGMTPEAVVSGEFTGDTNPDIAVVNGGSDSVMILAGNGMGGFSSTVSVAVGSTPVDLVALDFNGDQLIDLVTVNSGDNTVSLIKNNGAGMFAAAVSFAIGSQPVAIAGGDVNRDGFDDIAIATAADDVLIRFSTGASFDPELMLGSVDSPSDIALLDEDGDTFPGIAVTSASSGTVTVFENSRGMLTAGGVFPTGGAPGSIAVADGNSDGLDDFITSNAGSGDVTRLINLHGSAVVNVQTGITTAGAEFGNLLSGSISGTKFHDLDQDGNQDPGEPGLSGFGIYIDQNQNNQLDQSEPSVVTGVDGTFTFTGVEAGVPLTLREIQQSGFVQTTPKELTLRSIGDLNLAGGQRAFSSGNLIASGDLNGDGERDSVIVNPGIDSVSVVEFHMGSAPVRVDIPVGISPRSVHLADVNADGHLDILTANNGSGNVSVILNNGDGSYSAASQFSAGATPQDLTTADFNGDSSPDIAVSNSLTGDVQILMNTGSGSFAAPVSITLSTATSGEAIEAGDFDGDGNADLVVLSEDLFGVVVLRNLGGTQFEELDAVAVGMFPTGAATGDLDGDSDLDLVVTNTADGTVQFLLNDSNGVFTPGAPFSVGGAPGAVTLSDLDGDGHLDAVVANQTLPDVTVLLGDGAGGVDSSLAVDAGGGQDGVGVVSIPANGQPGIVATKFMAGTLAGLVNFTGTHQITLDSAEAAVGVDFGNFSLPGEVSGLAYEDVNENGQPDPGEPGLAGVTIYADLNNNDVTDPGEPLTVSAQDGTYTLSGLTSLTEYTISEQLPVGSVQLEPIDVEFLTTGQITGVNDAFGIQSTDLNNDGRTDLVASSESTDTVQVLLRNVDGNFAAPVSYPVGTTPGTLILEDFNGDSLPDIAVANEGSGDVSVLLNNGMGGFAAADHYAAGLEPVSIIAADVTGDAISDLIVTAIQSNAVFILPGDGLGSFSVATSFSTGAMTAPLGLAVGLFDEDADLDIAVTLEDTQELQIFLNDGTGQFSANGPPLSAGMEPGEVVAVDVDGDSALDLVVVDAGGDNVLIFPGTGMGTFLAPSSVVTGDRPDAIVVVDVDLDGDSDLLVAIEEPESLTLLTNDGAGGFLASTAASTASGFSSIAVLNLNSDGEPDLAVTDENDSIQLLTNVRFSHRIFVDSGASITGQNFGNREINDPPTVAVAGTAVINEDDPLLFGMGEFVISDPDAGPGGVEVQLGVTNGVLTLSGTTGLSFSTGGNASSIMGFSGTVQDVNAALNGLVYSPTNDFSGASVLGVTVNDQGNTGLGGAMSVTATVDITVVPVNDAPILAGIPVAGIDYTENDPPVLLVPMATVSDVDNTQLNSAAIQIVSGYQATLDLLAANVAGTNISASFDSGTGTLNLSGADTLVNYRNVLRTIRYENTSEEPSGALRSVRLILNDGDRNSLPVVREIAVTPVNDAPAFGLPPMPLSVAENTAAGTLIHTVVVNDVDSTDDVVLSIAAGNTGNAFVIDTVTGQIRVNNSAALDFEVTPSFVLQILATDSSPVAPTPLTVQQNITINLTDLSEPFVIGPNAFSTGDVTLVRDGGNLRAVRAGTMTDVVPASAFANVASVVVDGRLNTADLLTVDFSAGDPIPAGGFSFSGKAGPGTDKLILTGAAATAVTQTFMMADSGGLDIDGQSVVYDGLEAVADQLTVQSRIFNFGNASSQVTLSDGDAPADGQSRLTSRLSGNTVDFSSPVLSLMLRLGNGDDDLETDSIDSTFDASVMVMGSGGNDQLSLAGFNNGPVTITGGAGSDTIDGGSGDDLLSGGTGADEFLSSPGDDMAQGNAGADVFHDRADDGNDVFQGGAGQDQVVLSSPTVPQVNISSDSVDTGQLLVPSKSSTSVVTFDGTEAVHVDSLVEETLTVDYSEFTVSMDALLTELEGTASITGAGLFDIFFGTDSEELVIIGGQADDVFTVTGLQAFTSGLSIDGDSGSDQAIVPGGLPAVGLDAGITFGVEMSQIAGVIRSKADAIGFDGAVTLTGNATLVGSETLFSGDVDTSGNALTVSGNSQFAGAETLAGTFQLNGNAFFVSPISVNGPMFNVNGNASFAAATTLEGMVDFQGQATFSGPLDVKGTVTASGSMVRLEGQTELQNGSITSTGSILVGVVSEMGPPIPVSLSGEGTLNANSLILLDGAILQPMPAIQTGNLTFAAGARLETTEPSVGTAMSNPVPLMVSGLLGLGDAEFVRTEGPAAPFIRRTLIDKTTPGAIQGTFSGLADGAGLDVPVVDMGVLSGLRRYVISYQGGDGNDLEIVPAASIAGVVFRDVADEDGLRGGAGAEPGQVGVTVELLNSEGAVLRQSSTDNDGMYRFDDLLPGQYRVHFVAPDLQHFTARDQGGDDTIDSDPNVLTGETGILNVMENDNFANVDAGLVDTTITILDAVPLNEGDSPPISVQSFIVALNGRTAHQVTVNAQVVQGADGRPVAMAAAGSDFLPFTNPGGLLPVVFNPGQTEQTVEVSILGDFEEEPDEGFVVQLSNPFQATIEDAVGFGLIRNDDFSEPIVVLGDDVTILEQQFPNKPVLEFRVELQGSPVSEDLIISYRTVEGADQGIGIATGMSLSPGELSDYIPAVNNVVVLPAGQTSTTISVSVIGDGLFEADESVTVELISISSDEPVNVTLGARTQAVGVIENDEIVIPSVSVHDGFTVEANAPAVSVLEFPVTLNGPAGSDVLLRYSTVELSGPGTASGSPGTGQDYIPLEMNTLRIPAGQTEAVISITIPGDQIDEADEVFAVELVEVHAGNAVLGETLAVGTIVNDDEAVLLASIHPGVSLHEGRAGQVTGFEFEISLTGDARGPVDVIVSTIDPEMDAISAAIPGDDVRTPDADYLRFSNRSVRIPAGQRTGFLRVNVIGDEVPEPDESLVVQIVNTSSGVGIDSLQSTAVGRILNDDGERTVVSIDSELSTTEGRPGLAKAVSIPVRLSVPSSEVITVDFETVTPIPGISVASEPADFTSRTGVGNRITFAPGQTLEFIQVLVNGDTEVEPPETFAVDLKGVSGNADLDPIATRSVVTLSDENAILPFVSIQSSETVDENDDNGLTEVELTVTLGGRVNSNVIVGYQILSGVTPGSATAAEDYLAVENGEVVIRAGRTSATLTALVVGDVIQEPQEQFFVQLKSVTPNAQIDRSAQQATVTILDNDAGLPTVRISDASVREGAPAAPNSSEATVNDPRLDFVISLSSVPDGPVSVEVEVGRVGNAPPGIARTEGASKDVFQTRRTLFFDTMNTSRVFSVRVVPDDIFEADEQVFVNVFNPIGAVLPAGPLRGVGTIIDDDPLTPTVSISSTRLLEGDPDETAVAILTVTLDTTTTAGSQGNPGSNGGSGNFTDVEVGFRTISLTATADDFTPVEGTLVFAEGVGSLDVEVPINGDLIDEMDEEFYVEIFDPGGNLPLEFDLNAFQGIVQIDNDDGPNVRFSIDNVKEREGTQSNTLFEFTVRRIGNSDQASTVEYFTSSGTAQSGVDFLSQSGTLVFEPDGPDTQTVQVSVIGDSIPEPKREKFFVTLRNPTNAVVSNKGRQGVGTILDDDMRVFEEDGNEELLIISERLTDAMGTSGANPDDTELLRLLEQFNREAIERLGPSLLITFDPVDFRLTDLAGRTVGYTDAGGEVTEVPLAFYSGDGDVELVVIPGASQGVYGLQLSGVGTGEYRLAATLVTADGYSETIFEAQTLSGDQQLALDFTEQALPLRGQVTEELSAINGKKPGSNSNTGDTVTLTDELAIDLDDFSVSQFDAPSDRIMESSGWDEVWDAGAEFMKQLSQLFVQLTDEVYSQVDRFPTDGLAKVGGAADSVESLLLDSVFSGIEGQAFGAPGVLLFDLVEFLNSQKQQEKNDSSGKADDAESENGENEGQPADKTERENSDSAALQRIIRLRRSVKAEQSDRNSPRALPANTLEEKRTATESVRSGFELRVSDRRLKEAERRDHVEPPADTERRKESRQKKA